MDKANKIVKLRMLAAFYRLQNMTNVQVRKLQMMYSVVINDLLNRIEKMGNGAIHKARLELELKYARNMFDMLSNRMAGTLETSAGSAGQAMLKDMGKILSWDGAYSGFAAVSLSSEQLLALAELSLIESVGGKKFPLQDWMIKIVEEPRRAFQEALAGIAAGKNPLKVAQELKGMLKPTTDRKEAAAVWRNLRTIVRTFMLGAGHGARSAVYEANKKVIDQYQWEATLEVGSGGRGTCTRCAALDGEKYKKESDAPPIPLHPNCKCLMIPITSSWSDILGKNVDINQEYKRWFKNDTVKSTVTAKPFSEWFTGLSPADQNKVIGPRRAELVRDGKVKFKDLVDEDGELIPIKNL